jgi:hypothetical protein
MQRYNNTSFPKFKMLPAAAHAMLNGALSASYPAAAAAVSAVSAAAVVWDQLWTILLCCGLRHRSCWLAHWCDLLLCLELACDGLSLGQLPPGGIGPPATHKTHAVVSGLTLVALSTKTIGNLSCCNTTQPTTTAPPDKWTLCRQGYIIWF